jgi:hypothetical protein
MVKDMTYAALLDFRIEELEVEISVLGELIAAKAMDEIETEDLSEMFSSQLEKLTFLKELWGQMLDSLHAEDISILIGRSLSLEANIAAQSTPHGPRLPHPTSLNL